MFCQNIEKVNHLLYPFYINFIHGDSKPTATEKNIFVNSSAFLSLPLSNNRNRVFFSITYINLIMRNYNSDRKSRGRDDREDRQMYKATCADCGKFCEVPFRPSGGKPVYCSNCFKKDSSPRSDERRGGRDRDRLRPEMFRATCAECGKKCEVPFKPSGDKPVYCSDCFGKEGKSGSGKSPQSNQMLEDISWKLDEVISLLKQMVPNKEEPVAEPKKKITKATAKKAAPKKTATKKPSAKKAAK